MSLEKVNSPVRMTFFVPRNRTVFFLAAGAIVLVFGLYNRFTTDFSYANPAINRKPSVSGEVSGTPWPEYLTGSKADSQIANGTLGFGKIFALGLPDRTDKRDALELTAALTGIKFEWADGVLVDQMNPKAIPPVHDDPKGGLKKDAEVGCWRGHMNIMRKIVKEGIESALIIEDDADWDVHIVQQLQKFAVASRTVLAAKQPRQHAGRPKLNSPYGNDWDILWIGHLNGWPPGREQPFAVIKNDDTVPPAFDIQDLTRGIGAATKECSAHEGRDPEGAVCDKPRLASNERIVQEGGSPTSLVGYAVSQQGARKILARIGGVAVMDVHAQVDPELSEFCRGDRKEDAEGPNKIRCLIPSPGYIKPHKGRGPMKSDSDIETAEKADEVREVGWSKGLVYSTRLNIGNLIDGLELESQYVKDNVTGEWRYRQKNEYRAHANDK